MVTTMIGERLYPDFAGKGMPGVVADMVDKNGKPVAFGTRGFLAIREPCPSMLRTVYKDDERYRNYWNTIPGWFDGGDLAVKTGKGISWCRAGLTISSLLRSQHRDGRGGKRAGVAQGCCRGRGHQQAG